MIFPIKYKTLYVLAYRLESRFLDASRAEKGMAPVLC
jgi:hypothetical protein